MARLTPLLLAMLVVLVAVNAIAAAPVTLTEEKKQEIAYITLMQQAAIDDPKVLFEAAFVSRALQKNKNIDRSELNGLILLVHDKWRIAGVDRWTYAVDVSDRILGGFLDVIKISDNKYAALAKDLYDDVLIPTIKDFADDKDYVTSVTAISSLWRTSRSEKGRQILERFRQSCMQTENTKDACDVIFGPRMNLSVRDSFDTIVHQHSGVAVLRELAGESFDPEVVFARLLDEISGVHQLTKNNLEFIKQLSQQFGQLDGSFTAWIADQRNRPQAIAIAEANRIYDELKLPAAQSAIYVLSSLVGLANPERGRQIGVVSGAALQVANAASRFGESAAWVSKLEQGKQKWATTMSATVMTADIVGAALQVFSLFQATGPSPEAVMLQELQKIARQIEQMRTEMHERFDRVDAALNEIYTIMGQNFARIDWQLGVISGDLRDVQVALLDVQEKLTRLESNMHGFLDTASRIDLLTSVNGYLRYTERTGQEMPYSPTFIDAENYFQSWATIHSRDTIRAGIPRTNINDMLDDLAAFPLHYNINNLRVYPSLALGKPALQNNRLGNPLDALFAAHAWMTLMDENPQHARRIGGFRRNAIRQTLSQVQDAFGNILDPSLFAGLIADYRTQGNFVATEIARIENDYRNAPGNAALLGVDLWGSAKQDVAFLLPSGPIDNCNGSDLNLSGYADLRALEVPAGFLLAAKLGVGSLSLCARVTAYLECDDCDYDWFVYVDTRYNDQTVQTRGGHAGRFYWGSEAEAALWRCLAMGTSCDSWEQQGWRDRMPTYPLIPADDQTQSAIAQLLHQAEQSVEAVLASAQTGFYAQVLGAFNGASSLTALTKQLSYRRQVLISYMALGLPRAVAQDDYLRSLVSGKSDGLLDTEGVRGLYQSASTRVSGGETVPKVDVSVITAERANVLQTEIGRTIAAIAAGDLIEGNRLIDYALLRLDAGANAMLAPSISPGLLQSAVSRKTNGLAGTFDLPLNTVATNPTTEPRQGPAHTIVFTFDKQITGATATVTEGAAFAGAPTFSDNEVTVNLTGVTNQQYVTVAVGNVTAADGSTGGSGSIRVGFLLGDVNQSRAVTLSDLGLVNAQIAQPVTTANYLKDVNVSGTLSLADKGITNTQITRALPPP